MMAVYAAGLLRRVLAGEATATLRLRKGIFEKKIVPALTALEAKASHDGAVHHLMMLDPVVTIFRHMLMGTFSSEPHLSSRLRRLDLPITTAFLYPDGELGIIMFIRHYYHSCFHIIYTILSYCEGGDHVWHSDLELPVHRLP
jgi:hypothetical protein